MSYNFFSKFFQKIFFYATWTLDICSCYQTLKIGKKLKNNQINTDPALVIRFEPPISNTLTPDKISCNFFGELIRKIFFYATWTLDICSCFQTLKTIKKLKNNQIITDPALVLHFAREGYWVPISDIQNSYNIRSNFVVEYFLKIFFMQHGNLRSVLAATV